MPPSFAWGSRVAQRAAEHRFPGYLNINATHGRRDQPDEGRGPAHAQDRVLQHAQLQGSSSAAASAFGTINFQQDTVGTNPFDTSFGFANAAIGMLQLVSSRRRSTSRASYVYNNTEGYIQDNWKVNSKLTLDYGVRLVHQQPQYDTLRPGVELPARQVDASAGAACCTSPAAPTASYPCTGTNRQAMNPLTGQFLGPNSHARDRHARARTSGNPTNGLFLPGKGIAETTYTWPALGVAPRFGMAYDVTGKQTIVLRGGGGLFFDRPSGNAVFAQVQQPADVDERHGALRAAAEPRQRRPDDRRRRRRSAVFEYDSELPSSSQWNGGVQMALPWAIVARRRRTSASTATTRSDGVNINAVDFGAAFLPQNQDPTLRAERDAGRDGGVDRSDARVSAATATITQQSAARLARRTTRFSCRSTAASATACRSASTTRSGSRDRQQRRRAAAAQRRTASFTYPRRSGGGRRAARQRRSARAHR